MILGLCHFLNSRLNSIDLFEDVCPIKAKKGHTNVLAGLEILAIRKRRNDIPISMKMLKGILIDVPISMKKSNIDQGVDKNEGYQRDILFHLLARC